MYITSIFLYISNIERRNPPKRTITAHVSVLLRLERTDEILLNRMIGNKSKMRIQNSRNRSRIYKRGAQNARAKNQ